MKLSLHWNTAALSLWTLLAAFSADARAQQLLDWTARGSALPEALASGAAAVLWNPGRIAPETGRLEAFILDLDGPSTTGLSGVAIAGSGRLPKGPVVGLGYQHLAIAGIPVTENSPAGEEDFEASVAEDRFTLAGAQAIGTGTSAGAVIQYDRSSNETETTDELTFGAGFSYRGTSRLHPMAGAAAFVGTETRWIAGIGATPPLSLPAAARLQVSYGISGSERQKTPSHRLALSGRWQDRAGVTVAVTAEPGAAGTTLQPVLAADLRLGRYMLGVMREGMPNEFGATYSYRLNVQL